MAKLVGGPNFNINKQIGASTGILSSDDLLNTTSGFDFYSSIAGYVLPVYYSPYRGDGSYSEEDATDGVTPYGSLNQVAYAAAMVSQSGVELGIDFSDYSNFIHFGSAEERLVHFRDKLESIQYHASQSEDLQKYYVASAEYQSSSILHHQTEIVNILQELDPYDRYLYFGTEPTSWPKDSNNKHYSVDSSEALSWFTNQLEKASGYDLQNTNRLINTIPDYLRDDDVSSPGLLFVDMIGQHYDNLLLYSDAISSKFDTDNRLNRGVSRDLIGEALRGLGIKLYESQFNATDLARLYIGHSFPTGSEVISTQHIAADTIPSTKDYLDTISKRLYHNVPLLLQTKGTRRGLRALINAFGIPSEGLHIREFGNNTGLSSSFIASQGINREGYLLTEESETLTNHQGFKLLSDGEDFFYTSQTNFGDNQYTTSSLERIRINDSGSLLSGSTLLKHRSVNDVYDIYSQDLHTIEVGWSPNDLKNEYILKTSSSNFDIDQYIGDPRETFKTRYKALEKHTSELLPQSQENTLYAFLRTLRYYDTQLFSMLSDFVPARTSLRKGAVIKPHLLERSKVNVGSISFTNEQYTSSIDVYEVDGGSSNIWDTHDTTHQVTNRTIAGNVVENVEDRRETYNGELSGSIIKVTDGELNANNDLKKISLKPYNYDTTRYTNLNNFNNLPVQPGNILLYYSDPFQVDTDQGSGIGGPILSTTYTQTVNVLFDYNLNLDVTHIHAYVMKNNNIVATSINPSAGDTVATISGLVASDEIKIGITAHPDAASINGIEVEILDQGVVKSTSTASYYSTTTYTYQVPLLTVNGTSKTFNLRVR